MLIRLLKDVPEVGKSGEVVEVGIDLAVHLAMRNRARPVRQKPGEQREKAILEDKPE